METMLRSWRLWILVILAVIVGVFALDYMIASARLNGITVTTTLETPNVIADGQHTATFVVQFTENGEPRANDLVQLWLVKGSGQLVPQWAFLDDQGKARISFTPVPYNRYDPQDHVQINFKDTTIGRLIEVGKESSVSIPLIVPDGKK
jgi:uncharacterized protein (DUF58 family)